MAADFGHDEAWEHLGDLEECYDELRHDDDGYRVMWIRFHLARAYFLGEDGVPCDDDKALIHLEEFVDASGLPQQDYYDELIDGLPDACVDTIRTWFRAEPFRAVQRRVNKLHQLHDIGSVPRVVMDDQLERLRTEVDELARIIRKDEPA